MNNTVIKLRDISKKRGQTEILNHLNMTVYQKDIYGFIGQNGAGKSTIMKIIMSLIKETQGQLELFDTLDNQINRSRIGAIIENPAFYPYMTAYENLKYYIQYKGIVEINSIEKVLKMVGLENARKKKYKNYSLGMKQRLGLALALINHPDLLILDEPLNGLDPQGIVELREILSHLNKKYGITMLISSHILDELEMIATRYGFIHQGQMIEEITAEKLQEKLKKYISLDVENIGLASITLEQKLHTENFKVMDDHTIYLYDFVNESSQVATTLIQEGVILNKMNISNVSLENYYLSLIKGVESHV
ncbi:MAG: ATP-binding cassette domain-containing protein [Faecalibacillus intestinalis]|uniref:ATP-binding cassette domain-containing protein n=1 Tax=Faecalibacillus intestinalis TaxID=1982626 RepID=UPI00399FCF71